MRALALGLMLLVAGCGSTTSGQIVDPSISWRGTAALNRSEWAVLHESQFAQNPALRANPLNGATEACGEPRPPRRFEWNAISPTIRLPTSPRVN